MQRRSPRQIRPPSDAARRAFERHNSTPITDGRQRKRTSTSAVVRRNSAGLKRQRSDTVLTDSTASDGFDELLSFGNGFDLHSDVDWMVKEVMFPPSSRQLKRLKSAMESKRCLEERREKETLRMEEIYKSEKLKCERCSRLFLTGSGHDLHMEAFHPELATRCCRCQMAFSSRKGYQIHCKKVHPTNQTSPSSSGAGPTTDTTSTFGSVNDRDRTVASRPVLDMTYQGISPQLRHCICGLHFPTTDDLILHASYCSAAKLSSQPDHRKAPCQSSKDDSLKTEENGVVLSALGLATKKPVVKSVNAVPSIYGLLTYNKSHAKQLTADASQPTVAAVPSSPKVAPKLEPPSERLNGDVGQSQQGQRFCDTGSFLAELRPPAKPLRIDELYNRLTAGSACQSLPRSLCNDVSCAS